MRQNFLVSLPPQERQALLAASLVPEFATLFERLPALKAALSAPVEDELLELVNCLQHASVSPQAYFVALDLASRMSEQKQAQEASQRQALGLPDPAPYPV